MPIIEHYTPFSESMGLKCTLLHELLEVVVAFYAKQKLGGRTVMSQCTGSILD